MKLALWVRRSSALILLMLCASAGQIAWGGSVSIRGARPDFVLLVALICSQFSGANQSSAVGFAAGLLTAAMAAPPNGGFGSLVVSRTLACFTIGWLEERVFRDNAFIAVAIAAGGTLLAEGMFFAFDPHFRVREWARGVGFEVAYNACLTIPVYFLVRLCLAPRKAVTVAPAQ